MNLGEQVSGISSCTYILHLPGLWDNRLVLFPLEQTCYFYQDLIQLKVLSLGEQVSGILQGPRTVQCVRTERTG